MKPRYLFLLTVCAAFVNQAAWAGGVNLPLKAGQFSSTTTGSLAVCLDPANNFVEVACSAPGAFAFPLQDLNVGYTITDSKGNSCETFTQTISNLPVDITLPDVSFQNHTVGQVTHYDPMTGDGDVSFKGYTGGHCNGASFDSTGATPGASGTAHFTVSENGNREDVLITALQDSAMGIGDFSLSGVNRLQQTSKSQDSQD
jgi:hypothetical protein